jgi:hypothetical protein
METLIRPDTTGPQELSFEEMAGPWRAMSSLVSSNQQESNMQRALLNRATMRVADTTEVSGRVTADEVNLDRFHNCIRKVCALGRTWLALVTASVGLYLVLPERGAAQVTVGTFRGTYVFGFTGYTIDASGNHTPFADGGRETYFGNGHSAGVFTFTTNGFIGSRLSFTATYTVNADGSASETVTDENGHVSHFDVYITRDGSTFGFVGTDPGVISAGVATRSSPTGNEQ